MSVPGRRWIREGIALCLGIKALLFVLGAVAVEVRENRPIRTWASAIALWEHPDASAPPFLALLLDGRDHGRGTGSPLVPWALAALVSLFPAPLLYALARSDEDEETSFRAMLALLLSPGAFVLHLPWTDAAFISLILGAFLAARRERWGAVAVLGLMGGLIRPEGALLGPALAAEAWISAGGHLRIRRVFVSLSPLAGLLLASSLSGGGPLLGAFLTGRGWPSMGLHESLELARAGRAAGVLTGTTALAAGTFLLGASLAAVLWQRWSYVVWTVGVTLIFTTGATWPAGPRVVLTCFPAFILLGRLTGRGIAGSLWFAGSTLLLSLLTTQFTLAHR